MFILNYWGGKQERLNLSQNQLLITENFKTPSSSKPILVKLSDEDKRLHEDILKKINRPIWG